MLQVNIMTALNHPHIMTFYGCKTKPHMCAVVELVRPNAPRSVQVAALFSLRRHTKAGRHSICASEISGQ